MEAKPMEYTGFWNQVNKITNYEMLRGHSQDIQNLENALEVRLDLEVQKLIGTSMWGTIMDYENRPLANQMVKLIRNCQSDDGEYYKVIDYTQTDCNGYYRLDAYGDQGDRYHILVESPEPVRITCDYLKSESCPVYENREGPENVYEEMQPELDTRQVTHQMNSYDYTQDEPIYRSLNNRSGAKFYANSTYPYNRLD